MGGTITDPEWSCSGDINGSQVTGVFNPTNSTTPINTTTLPTTTTQTTPTPTTTTTTTTTTPTTTTTTTPTTTTTTPTTTTTTPTTTTTTPTISSTTYTTPPHVCDDIPCDTYGTVILPYLCNSTDTTVEQQCGMDCGGPNRHVCYTPCQQPPTPLEELVCAATMTPDPCINDCNKTCASLSLSECIRPTTEECVPGCVEPGKVWDEQREQWVDPSECGCVFHSSLENLEAIYLPPTYSLEVYSLNSYLYQYWFSGSINFYRCPLLDPDASETEKPCTMTCESGVIDLSYACQCEYEGDLYDPGQPIETGDPCYVCECTNNMGEVQCHKIDVDPPVCAADETLEQIDGECGYECVKPKCEYPITAAKNFSYEDNGLDAVTGDGVRIECVTPEEVDYSYCSGSCGPSIYIPDSMDISNGMKSMCECCRPRETSLRAVSFNCFYEVVYGGKSLYLHDIERELDMPLDIRGGCGCEVCNGQPQLFYLRPLQRKPKVTLKIYSMKTDSELIPSNLANCTVNIDDAPYNPVEILPGVWEILAPATVFGKETFVSCPGFVPWKNEFPPIISRGDWLESRVYLIPDNVVDENEAYLQLFYDGNARLDLKVAGSCEDNLQYDQNCTNSIIPRYSSDSGVNSYSWTLIHEAKNEFNAPAVVRVAPLNYIGDDKVYVYVTRSKAGKFLTSKMVKQYDIVVTMQHGTDIEEIKTIKLKRTKTAYEKNPDPSVYGDLDCPQWVVGYFQTIGGKVKFVQDNRCIYYDKQDDACPAVNLRTQLGLPAVGPAVGI